MPTQPEQQTPTTENPDVLVAWGPPQNNFHNFRVLCDLAGLSLSAKNDLCACVYQESQFFNYLPNGTPVKHKNPESTDWGMYQINDFYHIAPTGGPFESVQYVLENPQPVGEWMIEQYKAGLLIEWDSYASGAYLKWLEPNSPMWKLKTLP